MEELPEENLPLSRTKKKQLAKQIEGLADQLAEMSEKQYAKLRLSAGLTDEVALARSTVGRGSHKRQVKHLAGFLRKQDDELQALLTQMESLDQVARVDKHEFKRIEDLRDRLCAQSSFEQALHELLELFPQIDRKAITRLASSVHQHEDRRAFREIFRRLRDAIEAQATDPD